MKKLTLSALVVIASSAAATAALAQDVAAGKTSFNK
jgi:cytochrome c